MTDPQVDTAPHVTPALLVTGAGGQLATDLLAQAGSLRFARGVTRAQLDLTDAAGIRRLVADWARTVRSDSPDIRPVVVNAAAYTAVDAAEDDEATAYAVNAAGPGLLATACAQAGAHLVQVSTDYVFPGDAAEPYDVDAPTGPRSAYGRTKLAGEQAVRELLPDASWVVRTAWLYGASGGNFVKTMARLERERETVQVVDDQRGSPTCTHDLAGALLALAGSAAPPGTLHATNWGDTTWHGLTQAIFSELGADPQRVLPTTSAQFVRPAPRPAYSVLSPRAWDGAGLPPLQGWREALAAAFARDGAAYRG